MGYLEMRRKLSEKIECLMGRCEPSEEVLITSDVEIDRCPRCGKTREVKVDISKPIPEEEIIFFKPNNNRKMEGLQKAKSEQVSLKETIELADLNLAEAHDLCDAIIASLENMGMEEKPKNKGLEEPGSLSEVLQKKLQGFYDTRANLEEKLNKIRNMIGVVLLMFCVSVGFGQEKASDGNVIITSEAEMIAPIMTIEPNTGDLTVPSDDITITVDENGNVTYGPVLLAEDYNYVIEPYTGDLIVPAPGDKVFAIMPHTLFMDLGIFAIYTEDPASSGLGAEKVEFFNPDQWKQVNVISDQLANGVQTYTINMWDLNGNVKTYTGVIFIGPNFNILNSVPLNINPLD